MSFPMAPPAGGSRSWALLGRHAPALLLTLTAFVLGLVVKLAVFPYLSWNSDEGVYLAQAEALRAGQLTWPAATHGDFFRPWLTGEHAGAYFTKYLPGYPALLAAAATLTGTTIFVPALGAALWVLGAYVLAWELFRSRRTALLAGVLTLCSPLLIVHSGVYLTYAVSTGVLLLATAALVRGARLRSPGLLLAAGALVGVAVLLRQYDVVLVGLPVAAYVLLRHARSPRQALPVVAWSALGMLPALLVVLAYNAAVTGGPLRLPLPAADALDTFGFGPRRMLPTEPLMQFAPTDAVSALVTHLAAVPQWVAGGLLLPVAALAALWLGEGRLRAERAMLAGIVAIVPVGYFFFWGPALSADLGLGRLGPFYYTPALAALTLLAAAGVDALVRRALPHRTLAMAGLGLAAAGLTAASVVTAIAAQGYFTDRARAVDAALPAPSQVPAVVLVSAPDGRPYVGQPYAFLRNDPDLGNDVLYAASQGARDRDVFAASPGRAVYGLRLPFWREGEPVRPGDASFVRLRPVQGAGVQAQTTVRSPVASGCLTAFAVLGDQVRTRELTCSPGIGSVYDTTWRVGPDADLALPSPGEHALLVTGVVAGPAGSGPDTPGVPVWEDRHSVGVDATPTGPRAEVLVPGEAWHRAGPGTEAPTGRWDPRLVGEVVQTTVTPLS